jgi:hypothetical protein
LSHGDIWPLAFAVSREVPSSTKCRSIAGIVPAMREPGGDNFPLGFRSSQMRRLNVEPQILTPDLSQR